MDFVRVTAAVLLCLAVAFMAVLARRRGLTFPGRAPRNLRVCESAALDPRTSAHVLAWGERRWLVVSGNGALQLRELKAPAQEAPHARS